MDIQPLLSSHYSLGRSLLTLEKKGTSSATGPQSIIDLAILHKLGKIVLVEDNMSGFLEAYTNCKDAKIPLIFGLRLTFCADASQKDEESLSTEHKVIIFARNHAGYKRLIKISPAAATTNFYYQPRMDFKELKGHWNNDDLSMGIPFYSSFLAQNALTFSSCVPDFGFTKPVFFQESNKLPIDHIINCRLTEFTRDKFEVIRAKSIYYHKREDFLALNVLRCI